MDIKEWFDNEVTTLSVGETCCFRASNLFVFFEKETDCLRVELNSGCVDENNHNCLDDVLTSDSFNDYGEAFNYFNDLISRG